MVKSTEDDVKISCNIYISYACTGIKAGTEGGVHSIWQLYDEKAYSGFG